MTLHIPLEPSGPWRDLSPDMAAPIKVGRFEWPTSTHFFEAGRLWFERDRQRAIADAPTPKEARRMAAEPSFYDHERERLGTTEDPHMYWRGTWPNLIRRAIHERALSDEAFVGTLVETSDEDLVLDTDEPWIGRPDNGWGRGLMEMRSRLSMVRVTTLRSWWMPPWLEHPEIPNGSIGWRMGYGEAYLDRFFVWRGSLDPEALALFDQVYPGWPRDTFMPGLANSKLPFMVAWGWEP